MAISFPGARLPVLSGSRWLRAEIGGKPEADADLHRVRILQNVLGAGAITAASVAAIEALSGSAEAPEAGKITLAFLGWTATTFLFKKNCERLDRRDQQAQASQTVSEAPVAETKLVTNANGQPGLPTSSPELYLVAPPAKSDAA